MSGEVIRNEKRRVMRFRDLPPPPACDAEATVRWLRDRELIKNLYRRYQDDLVRVGDDWKIIRREIARQWHTGPFPRPHIGPAPYPRKGDESGRVRRVGAAAHPHEHSNTGNSSQGDHV